MAYLDDKRINTHGMSQEDLERGYSALSDDEFNLLFRKSTAGRPWDRFHKKKLRKDPGGLELFAATCSLDTVQEFIDKLANPAWEQTG